MRPSADAAELEVFGVGLLEMPSGLGLGDGIGEPVAFRVGYGFVAGIEFEPDLAMRIAGTGPAHQRINGLRSFGLELEHPVLGATQARLHGGSSWLEDACGQRVTLSRVDNMSGEIVQPENDGSSGTTKTGRRGRGDMIRTRDPLLPKQMLYQAELHPDASCHGCAGFVP